MSFMFKPLAYDDPNAFNVIDLSQKTKENAYVGTDVVCNKIVESVIENNTYKLAIDGYVSSTYTNGFFIDALEVAAKNHGVTCNVLSMDELYKSEEEINDLIKESLPLNYEQDPVLLFGRLYRGNYEDFVDKNKLNKIDELMAKDGIKIIHGLGSSCDLIRNYIDKLIFVDVTPKVCAIRAREKKYKNFGDKDFRPFNLLMRRNYYVDFEVATQNRKKLLKNDLIDFYVLGSDENKLYMLYKDGLNDVFDSLVNYPFRAKPVYLEGIWGGEFIRKVRKLPMDIAKNVAWIFEFIPMEVSIVVKINEDYFDFPFSTFLQKESLKMLGEKADREFEGYFPIRFNYDDTFHSNGNMSVQCHPDEDYVIKNYDEFGRQDEAYYIVATGHDAVTYLGWKGDGKEFLEQCKQSEVDHKMLDYKSYVNSVVSYPGRQVMIPAGTVHSSGRNQLVLELGSLTIGSYTYKVYDYNRIDKDGNYRPIHTNNALDVLRFERNSKWVDENIAIQPIPLNKTEQAEEFVVGRTELMYYETHKINIEIGGKYEASNNNQFTVLTVVDGEKVRISSKSHPEFNREANFLDIVTVPATITDYVVENLGYQPVVVHKTLLKENYSRYIDQKYWNR